MSSLSSLKLVSAKRPTALAPIQIRRNKLCGKLTEQIALATALRDGGTYAPKRLRTIKNKESGEVRSVEMAKRVHQWWWTEGNRILLQLKYGTRVLLLNGKDKNTIEIGSGDELIKVLELVKTSVNNGELDAAIEAASVKVRERFKK